MKGRQVQVWTKENQVQGVDKRETVAGRDEKRSVKFFHSCDNFFLFLSRNFKKFLASFCATFGILLVFAQF